MRTQGRATHANLIDRLTPDVILRWIPDALVDAARLDVERGRVARPAIRGNSIQAVVADAKRGQVRVGILEGPNGQLLAVCQCSASRRGPCRHAAALGLLLIGEAVPSTATGAEPQGTDRPMSLVERERAVRRERGASDLFSVTLGKGTRIYGSYMVTSPSSRRYEVILRALDAPHNGCTCPDFATNLLGTCKHIEAVLHRLRQRYPRKLASALQSGPAASYLYLRFEPEPELCVRLTRGATPAMRALFKHGFQADGRLAGTPSPTSLRSILRAAAEAGIEVPREVEGYVERVRDAADRERRARAVEAAVLGSGREPPGFRATLYPYQVAGVAFLASRERAILADDMGLGKTAQAIAAMVWLSRKEGVRRVVIICPASLKHQWQREIERFTDIPRDRVATVAGAREVRTQLYASPHEVLITSYELARTDARELESLAPDLLIIDEAQRIKNWRTRTAEAIKSIPSRCAFVLTGTPLENRLDDLYSLVQVIDPHLFGPLWRFNSEFTELDEHGRVTGYKSLDMLRERVAGVMLRRRREEVLSQLPERVVNRLMVPMTAEQAAIHEEAEQNVGRLVARLHNRPLTPAEEKQLMKAFQQMRMACDAAGLVDKKTVGSPKLSELAGLLEEICLEEGHKVLVFSEWEKMQAMAAEVCARLGVGHVRLHGGVAAGARGALVDRFTQDPECKVFLSTDAGGVGLNLQAASHVINLDLPWNPAVLAQRIARAHRIGQRRTVNVVLMISEGSFEVRLEATLGAKRALFAAVVGDDTQTVELQRSTLASRIATLMRGDFAATTGEQRGEPDEASGDAGDDEARRRSGHVDELTVLRERLGDALERVVLLPNGRLLGVVRGENVPAIEVSALLLPESTVNALAPLGDISPLSRAELLYKAEPSSLPDPALDARRARLAAGERKLAAANALLASGLGGEAFGLLREALALGCRAASVRADPGEEAAGLLSTVYGELVPSGAVSAADADALARAGELARAFSGSAVQPAEVLVTDLADRARELFARVREQLAPVGPVAASA